MRPAVTYVDHVGYVVDVVFGHQGVGRRQIEQIIVPRFCALELVFRVLSLSLEEKRQEKVQSSATQYGFVMRSDSECITGISVTFLMRLCQCTLGPLHTAEMGWMWFLLYLPEPFAAEADLRSIEGHSYRNHSWFILTGLAEVNVPPIVESWRKWNSSSSFDLWPIHWGSGQQQLSSHWAI